MLFWQTPSRTNVTGSIHLCRNQTRDFGLVLHTSRQTLRGIISTSVGDTTRQAGEKDDGFAELLSVARHCNLQDLDRTKATASDVAFRPSSGIASVPWGEPRATTVVVLDNRVEPRGMRGGRGWTLRSYRRGGSQGIVQNIAELYSGGLDTVSCYGHNWAAFISLNFGKHSFVVLNCFAAMKGNCVNVNCVNGINLLLFQVTYVSSCFLKDCWKCFANKFIRTTSDLDIGAQDH